MLSKLHLLMKSGDLLNAIKNYCTDVQLSASWEQNQVITIHLSTVSHGRRIHAWGSDRNESIALAKSLVELVERIHLMQAPATWQNLLSGELKTHKDLQSEWPVLSYFMATSSGMAAHFKRTESQKNSLHEIIERHVITRAMLQGVKAKAIFNDTFVWQGPLQTYVALVRHDTGNSRYVYGTAASKNMRSAIEAAKREISSTISWSRNSANINHLLKTAVANRPSEIQAFHLSESQDISVLDSTCSILTPDLSGITSKDIWIADITPLEAFAKLGIKITRAFSPLMQPLYFGKLSEGPINPLAIELKKLNIQAEYNVVA